MNPHKMNKIDVSAMSPEEQKAFKMYGKVPAKNLLTKMQKERKYFDSGDYMMSKAGVPTAQAPGTAIPTPEGVPHASPPNGATSPGLSSSPTGNQPQPSPFGEFGAPKAPAAAPEKPQHGPGVGVGISPSAISPSAQSEAMEVPIVHARRPSESHARVSPPGTMRENSNSSSFPIHHTGPLGASPVKTSALARRLDEEFEK